jgi:hypothetical protein
MRTPRAFLVSVLTTFVLAAQYLAGDLAGHQVYKHGIDTGVELIDQMVVKQFSPFYGTLLGLGDVPSGSRGDAVISFLAGAALALVLAWLVIWMVARGGSLAALFGAWFAAILATCFGDVVSTLLFARSNDFGGYPLQQLVGSGIDHGLHWGFFFGWGPGLVAALLATVFRKPASPVGQPLPGEAPFGAPMGEQQFGQQQAPQAFPPYRS